jgi:hypothetical protein
MHEGLALCLRPGSRAEAERQQIAVALSKTGFRVREINDGSWEPEREHTLLVLGNLNWFPKLRRQLLREGKPRNSRVVIWHTEPLPPPRASGLRWPLPTMRELAKIALRDARASDVYTNYFLLRALAQRGLPDVLAVSTRGRADFLAEHARTGQGRNGAARFPPAAFAVAMGISLGVARRPIPSGATRIRGRHLYSSPGGESPPPRR